MRSKLSWIVCTALLLASCGQGSGASSRSEAQDREPRREQHRAPKAEKPERGAEKAKPRKAGPQKPTKERKASTPAPPKRGPDVVVSRVIDGDTIEVGLRGVETGVRLIGFDTPETVHPSQPVECYGRAASTYTTNALGGRRVTLEFDIERSDRYGRTLAYVWLGKRLFNEQILRDGFAQVSTYPPNVMYVDRFLAAQRVARNNNKGLWARCDGGDGDKVAAAPEKPKKAVSGGTCDPNYSGACVPKYPPDIDCPDMTATDFRSKGSDPHGFDGDGDGIACESY